MNKYKIDDIVYYKNIPYIVYGIKKYVVKCILDQEEKVYYEYSLRNKTNSAFFTVGEQVLKQCFEENRDEICLQQKKN